jgi:hypothetical protein
MAATPSRPALGKAQVPASETPSAPLMSATEIEAAKIPYFRALAGRAIRFRSGRRRPVRADSPRFPAP